MAALGSSFITCIALDKTLGVRAPDTLITESAWVVALVLLYFIYNCRTSIIHSKNKLSCKALSCSHFFNSRRIFVVRLCGFSSILKDNCEIYSKSETL